MDRKKIIIICAGILLVASVIVAVIFMTEPSASKGGAVKQTAMLVDVIEADSGDFAPEIVATGTVTPSQDILLSSRVSGRVIDISEEFVPGGFLRQGEVAVTIDPSDYRNNLHQREADLEQALADLNIELGRQDVALQEYELLEEDLASENRSLVLREPQLNTAKAKVKAARAAVDQAELELLRTKITAPFDASVIERNVNTGSQVNPGERLARLVGVNEYWVEATVSVSELPWLDFPEKTGETGSTVKVINRSSPGKEKFRLGYLHKKVGVLAERTRMARIIIAVPDPLGIFSESDSIRSLIIGSFVEVRIQGKTIPGVVRLSRDHVRKNNTVWIMENGKLRIKELDVLFKDEKYAYVKSGLADGDSVVTTNLSTVADGADLRVGDEGPQNPDPDNSGNNESVSDTTEGEV